MMKSTDLENRCLTLLIWHRVEMRDEVNVFTRLLNVRVESSMIPRSLTKGKEARFWPRKGTLTSGILLISCRIPNTIGLVLRGLMTSLLVQHQAAMRRRSSVTLVRQKTIAGVTLQTFYLGKHDLLTVYLGKLDFLSVTNFSPGNLPRKNFIVWVLNMSRKQ